MSRELDVNKPVMFAAGSGSFGRIVETVENFGYHGTVYHVQWNYGLDVKGDPMYATSRYKKPLELVNIDEALYAEYIKLRGFQERDDCPQKAIRAKILAKVRETNRWI